MHEFAMDQLTKPFRVSDKTPKLHLEHLRTEPDSIWKHGFQIFKQGSQFFVECISADGITIIPAHLLLTQSYGNLHRFGYIQKQAIIDGSLTHAVEVLGTTSLEAQHRLVTIPWLSFIRIQAAIRRAIEENIRYREKKWNVPRQGNIADFLYRHFPSMIQVINPESYDSHTLQALNKEIDKRLNQLEQEAYPPTRYDEVQMCSQLIDELLPYSKEGENKTNPAKPLPADHEQFITEILEIGMGVCRQQAPVLVSLLCSRGYKAYLVEHDWESGGSGHLLVWVADQDIDCFVQPGELYDPLALIPRTHYTEYMGEKNKNWKIRLRDGTWETLPAWHV